jgi:hypothetical protein
MTPTSITRDEKEHVVTTLVIASYNGRGSGGRSSDHELITTNTPPYEHTS